MDIAATVSETARGWRSHIANVDDVKNGLRQIFSRGSNLQLLLQQRL
jgi:hypothetical protein